MALFPGTALDGARHDGCKDWSRSNCLSLFLPANRLPDCVTILGEDMKI